MSGNAVGWFEIYVNEMTRARKFYETVFQKTLEKLDVDGADMYAFPWDNNAYGAPGALIKMDGFAAGGNSVLVYFECADCAVEAARTAQNGGQVVKEKFGIGPYGFIALVLDTEGNMIGLHSAA